jgi:hypothetical protein
MKVDTLIEELEESVELTGAGGNIGGFPCDVVRVIVGLHIMVSNS